MIPEKIQRVPCFSFLGFSINKNIQPFTFKLNTKDEYTLTEFQQLCGTINWLKPFLSVSGLEMRHFFSLSIRPNMPLKKGDPTSGSKNCSTKYT